jgi:MFS family permease
MRFNIFLQSDIPKRYRSNFSHLYLDIAWFGVLSGTSINFLNIYATRLGASGLQIGLLTAMSAIVPLFLAIPAGHWIERQNTGRAVFWSSILFRVGYALWIPLPWLFNSQGQIWALIILAFLMAIPLTPLGVGFNALFAEAVPDQYRAHVAGTRNMTFAIAYMLTSFGIGYLLQHSHFPTGYQIMFGIGAFGAAMSSYHIYHVKPLQEESPTPQSGLQPASEKEASTPWSITSLLRLDIWKTRFRNVLIALFLFHLAHFLTGPIYPLYNVHILHLNDDNIGNGTAFYYFTVLIASTQLRRAVHRFGHKKVTAWGVAGMAAYPIMLAFAKNVMQFYALSFLGGFLWALVSGAYANYLLENIPPNDRPRHLAWYNIILNSAILISSLLGPAIAGVTGLVYALLIFGVLRILAGLAILKWG